MEADGKEGAGDDGDEVLGVCVLATLVKNGDCQETDEPAGERGDSDLHSHDKRSAWALMRFGQMPLAPGTGRHSRGFRRAGATITQGRSRTQAHSRCEARRPSYQSAQFRV